MWHRKDDGYILRGVCLLCGKEVPESDTTNRPADARPMTLAEVQREQRTWGQLNFGSQPAYRFLLGVQEELGELAHAQLKHEQGIRIQEDHRVAMYDAIGDTLIYLIAYCNVRGLDIGQLWLGRYAPPLVRHLESEAEFILRAGMCLADLIRLDLNTTDGNKGAMVGRIMTELDRFCEVRKWDLVKIAVFTWVNVRRRDWKADPLNAHKTDNDNRSGQEWR